MSTQAQVNFDFCHQHSSSLEQSDELEKLIESTNLAAADVRNKLTQMKDENKELGTFPLPIVTNFANRKS